MKKSVSILLSLLLAITAFASLTTFSASAADLIEDQLLAQAIKAKLGLSATDELGQNELASIVNLDVYDTRYDGIATLEGMQYCTNLQTFGIPYVGTFSDLSPLSGLTGLQKLNINGSAVSDLSPLENLTNLEALDACDTKVTDLSSLANLTKLKKISFDFCANGTAKISDISPLADLTKLEDVSIQNANISKINALEGKNKIFSLFLDMNKISDITPVDATNIIWFGISKNCVDFEDATQAAKMAEIKENGKYDDEGSRWSNQDPSAAPVDPTTEAPVVDPTTEEPVVDPTTEEPVVDPTTEEPVVDPTTEEPVITTEAPDLPPAGPEVALLIDDFNREDEDKYNIPLYLDHQSSIGIRGGVLQDNILTMTQAENPDRESIYYTSVELPDLDTTYKYLVMKVKGANGGEESQISLTNAYDLSDTARSLMSNLIDVDGNPVQITDRWQTVVVDLEASGMDFSVSGKLKSFYLTFRFDQATEPVEISFDEIYLADESTAPIVDPTTEAPVITTEEPVITTEEPVITTEAPDEPPVGPEVGLLIDDFNRDDENKYDIPNYLDHQSCIGIRGGVFEDGILKMTQVVGERESIYYTGVELTDNYPTDNPAYKYLVMKVKGAKGGEESQISMISDEAYPDSGDKRSLMSNLVDPDGNPIAITDEWQYVVVDIDKSGLNFFADGAMKSFNLTFRFDQATEDVEVWFDEIYLADEYDASQQPTTEQPPITTEQPPITTEQPPITTEQPPITTEQPPITTDPITNPTPTATDPITNPTPTATDPITNPTPTATDPITNPTPTATAPIPTDTVPTSYIIIPTPTATVAPTTLAPGGNTPGGNTPGGTNNPGTDVADIGLAIAIAALAAGGLVIATKKSK